jgi:hypothetical protein
MVVEKGGGGGERGRSEGAGRPGAAEGRTCVRARRLTCPLLPNANLLTHTACASYVLVRAGTCCTRGTQHATRNTQHVPASGDPIGWAPRADSRPLSSSVAVCIFRWGPYNGSSPGHPCRPPAARSSRKRTPLDSRGGLWAARRGVACGSGVRKVVGSLTRTRCWGYVAPAPAIYTEGPAPGHAASQLHPLGLAPAPTSGPLFTHASFCSTLKKERLDLDC